MLTPAYGAITAVSGETRKGDPPASVALNQPQHFDRGPGEGAHALNAEQDNTTKTETVLDICLPGNPSFAVCAPTAKSGEKYDTQPDVPRSAGKIPAGKCIDSHFLHAEPPNQSLAYTDDISFNRTGRSRR